MNSDHERLLVAQWIFERTLSWIAAAEVKVAVIVTVNTALLGGLGAAYTSLGTTKPTSWAMVWVTIAGISAAVGLFCAAMPVVPRLDGPKRSLLYFGRITKLNPIEYIEALKAASSASLLDDWGAQIHRNAEIAQIKHRWVRNSLCWSFFAMIPWGCGIVTLLHK